MNMKPTFDFEGIEDFDNHINLSIPDYNGLCDILRCIVTENTTRGGTVVDLGCSTGKFLHSLPQNGNCNYVGCDEVDIISPEHQHVFEFHQMCGLEYLRSLKDADVVCCTFFLQFLGRAKRCEIMKELLRLNQGGTTILIAEKVFSNSSKLNLALHREHVRKKRQGFTDTEILDKDYDLMGSMFCLSDREMSAQLRPFPVVDTVWQSYNFKAWCLSP